MGVIGEGCRDRGGQIAKRGKHFLSVVTGGSLTKVLPLGKGDL